MLCGERETVMGKEGENLRVSLMRQWTGCSFGHSSKWQPALMLRLRSLTAVSCCTRRVFVGAVHDVYLHSNEPDPSDKYRRSSNQKVWPAF